MSESGTVALETQLESALSAMRRDGAERFDPAGFQTVVSMSEKARKHRAKAAMVVRQRALERLKAYREKLRIEQKSVEPLATQIEQQHPEHAKQARQLFGAYQFAKLQQLAATLNRTEVDYQLGQLSQELSAMEPTPATARPSKQSARDILRQQEQDLTQQAVANKPSSVVSSPTQHTQLKSAQQCREALVQMEAEYLVAKASSAAPEDSGPLNPKKLAIRSLLTLQDLSPDYLGRFVIYLDTLAWLEQVD